MTRDSLSINYEQKILKTLLEKGKEVKIRKFLGYGLNPSEYKKLSKSRSRNPFLDRVGSLTKLKLIEEIGKKKNKTYYSITPFGIVNLFAGHNIEEYQAKRILDILQHYYRLNKKCFQRHEFVETNSSWRDVWENFEQIFELPRLLEKFFHAINSVHISKTEKYQDVTMEYRLPNNVVIKENNFRVRDEKINSIDEYYVDIDLDGPEQEASDMQFHVLIAKHIISNFYFLLFSELYYNEIKPLMEYDDYRDEKREWETLTFDDVIERMEHIKRRRIKELIKHSKPFSDEVIRHCLIIQDTISRRLSFAFSGIGKIRPYIANLVSWKGGEETGLEWKKVLLHVLKERKRVGTL